MNYKSVPYLDIWYILIFQIISQEKVKIPRDVTNPSSQNKEELPMEKAGRNENMKVMSI